MSRYIDADKIPYTISEDGCLDDFAYRYDINEVPTADVVEVRHGEWKAVGDRPRLIYECSECGKTLYYGVVLHSKFCFNCGAKMDGERSENGK